MVVSTWEKNKRNAVVKAIRFLGFQQRFPPEQIKPLEVCRVLATIRNERLSVKHAIDNLEKADYIKQWKRSKIRVGLSARCGAKRSHGRMPSKFNNSYVPDKVVRLSTGCDPVGLSWHASAKFSGLKYTCSSPRKAKQHLKKKRLHSCSENADALNAKDLDTSRQIPTKHHNKRIQTRGGDRNKTLKRVVRS